MSDLPATFDYTLLDQVARVIASQAAANIRAHGKLATQSIIAIGAELTKVKEAIGRGNYLVWINAEFGWSDRTARNYVRVYEAFKSETVSDLEPIDAKALYLLAAPSTPEPVREAALERAAAGERVTHGGVKALLHGERNQADRAVDPQPLAFSGAGAEPSAQEGETEQTEAEPEEEEQAEIDNTEFILEHIKDAYELVYRYSNWKPRNIAGLIDPARRSDALAKKTKRLGNWFKDLGYWLERGR